MGRLDGRAAFITGAASGIGRAIARRFAAEGATVAVADLDGARAEETAREIGPAASAHPLDVGDAAAVTAAIEGFAERCGRLDILVNNAGIAADDLLVRMSEESWETVLRVNLTGPFLCTRAALKPMIRRRSGRVISMTSIVGVAGEAGKTNYAASKGGLIAFTKCVAKEVATRGVTVNAIAPGLVTTPLTDRMPEAVRDAIVRSVPAGRPGTPEEVAAAALYLASDEAAYVTGRVLHVNGGLLAA